MAPKLSQANRIVSLSTPALGADALALTRFDGGEGVSELFEYRIEAISDQETIDFDKAIGTHFSVTFRTRDGGERLFDGILVEAQWLGMRKEHHAYRVVLKPWLWLLSRTTDCRVFMNKSVPDIIQEVFAEVGGDVEPGLKESYDPLEFCVQYRETDLAFVSRLMEQNGIYYYFKHEAGKHTMVLADAKSSLHKPPGKGPITYAALLDHDRATAGEHFYRLTGQRRFRTGKVALKDYNFTKPNNELLTEQSAGESYAHSDMEYYDYPGKYEETGPGERLAKIRLDAEQALDQRRQASGDAVSLYPGRLITLEKHPLASENAEFLVVRAQHAYVAPSYSTTDDDDEVEETYFGTYELLPSDRTYRAALLTERPVIHGPQTARVVGSPGEEIDVDKYGRIKVRFFWDRDKTHSLPVRVAQVWSGKNWGGLFIPRVDQEVVVVFLEGDPDRPLIVGAVYNADNMSPYELPGNKTQSGFKSLSSKKGGGYNEIMFEDKKDSEFIRAHAQKDLLVKVLNDEKRDIDHDLEVNVGNKVTISAKQSIELKVGTNNVFIDGSGVKINGVAQITAEAPATKVNGAITLTLTGALVKIN